MTTHCTYFFIDGSALTAQIRQLRRSDESYKSQILDIQRFIAYFMRTLGDLHQNGYKRVTFYFPNGDETAISDYLTPLSHDTPDAVRDVHIKFCGQKLKRADKFNEFVETKVPKEFRGNFSKSEKGIDIEICCDAFKLASFARLDRLFLFTNDDDFIPFCRTIKDFGANISILGLSNSTTKNLSLLKEVDSFHVISDDTLKHIFVDTPSIDEKNNSKPNASETNPAAPSTKPEAPPSDLKIATEIIDESTSSHDD